MVRIVKQNKLAEVRVWHAGDSGMSEVRRKQQACYCITPAPVHLENRKTQAGSQERRRPSEVDVPALKMARVGSDRPLERAPRLREPSMNSGWQGASVPRAAHYCAACGGFC